jgi:basic membrane protein A
MDLSVGTFPTLPRVAEQNPDTQFMQIVVPLEVPSNLHYAFPDWYPLGYLAGAVAALNTKTNTVGFVGGGEIPPTIRAREGFAAGAKATKPGVKVVNTSSGDFNDPLKGSDATGRRHTVQFGTDREGWTRARVEAELDEIRARIKLGI